MLDADKHTIELHANEIPIVTELDANEIPVTIHMDGATLVCAVRVAPQDYQDAEVERHDLPAMKGATSTTLPTMDSPNQMILPLTESGEQTSTKECGSKLGIMPPLEAPHFGH